MQVQGWRVCVIEKRRVEGRNQEWNISRDELEVGTAPAVFQIKKMGGCKCWVFYMFLKNFSMGA